MEWDNHHKWMLVWSRCESSDAWWPLQKTVLTREIMWQMRYQARWKLLTMGHDHCRYLSVSLSDLENVPSQFPEQHCFCWLHSVTLHGPCPLPHLSGAGRLWVLHRAILLASWARALSPSSQYLQGEGEGGRKGAGYHCSLPIVWAQDQAHSHNTFVLTFFP